jgi:hypothetical protein
VTAGSADVVVVDGAVVEVVAPGALVEVRPTPSVAAGPALVRSCEHPATSQQRDVATRNVLTAATAVTVRKYTKVRQPDLQRERVPVTNQARRRS